MRLEDIGFYTLDDARAAAVSNTSRLWRCELILTDKCNFNCPYCRGIEEEHQGAMSMAHAKAVVDIWAKNGLKNIRFSGGEPTVWKGLLELVEYTKAKGVERIALSTNGSVSLKFYEKLVAAGVNDFSISLDACCAETGDKMAGNKPGAWQRVVDNIRALSKMTYVTVGVVLTPENIDEFYQIVDFASNDLGVADIRILTSAQWNESLKDVVLPAETLAKHPILRYRMAHFNQGRHVRGLKPTDANRCPLALDDMAVLDGYHYPCIIYMREQGQPIGRLTESVREERHQWFLSHDTHKDPICAKNCLDVCIDINNKIFATNDFVQDALQRARAPQARRVIPIHPQ